MQGFENGFPAGFLDGFPDGLPDGFMDQFPDGFNGGEVIIHYHVSSAAPVSSAPPV